MIGFMGGNVSKNVCMWSFDKSEDDTRCYDTSCGSGHMFIDGGIEDNDYKFCPYCGKEIESDPY